MSKTEETETTVTYDHQEKVYLIWTNYRPHLNKFRKDERAINGLQGEDWGEFTIPADKFSIVRGFKSIRNLSPEQKAAAAERLSKARANKNNEEN